MAIKLGATGITFHDNSVQTTAGGPVTTQYAIGSYVMGRPANFTSYNNATIAGTSLYATTSNTFYSDTYRETSVFAGWAGLATWFQGLGSASGAWTSLVNTGSWRCVSYAGGGASDGGYPGLWVRYA